MRILALGALLTLAACGTPRPTPDGGSVDTSCGLDCDGQKLFGLLLNNCFEYSDGTSTVNPPALGVYVQDVFTLEGGVKTLRVVYSSGGQNKMTDYFAFPDRKLTLMRREYANAQSVTWKDSNNTIVGVPWVADATPVTGTTADTTNTAYLVTSSSGQKQESTEYRVTATDSSSSELSVPAMTYTSGLTLLFNETPDHGADGRRVFVPQVGFINFTTPFALSGGTAMQYRLQAARSVDNADAGGHVCGLGGP